MDYVNALLSLLDGLTNDPEHAQVGFAILFGAAAFALMAAMLLLVAGLADPLRRRLRHLAPTEQEASAKKEVLTRVFGPVGVHLVPRREEALSKARARMRHAGIRSPNALVTFYGAKLGLAVVFPSVAIVIMSTLISPAPAAALLFTIAGSMAGYLLPSLWLERAVRCRQRSLRRALPDALDLLVVCSEAGLGLGAGIQRVARDLEVSHPVLAEELNLFGMQTRAGMSNRDALRDLEERSGVEDIRGLVTTLIQSMRFGTSVADTLRIYSEELRDKRMQQAEERAAKVGTKMLFPLVTCIFPSFFVVTLGPPILGAIAALRHVH